MASHPRRLTDRQERFVAAYLACGRVVAAARTAGYSETTATHSTARLMRAPHIRAALAEGRAAAERHGAKLRDRVVQELERIAFAPSDNGTIRTADKLRALDLLGRMAERSLRQEKEKRADTTKTAQKPASTSMIPDWKERMRRGMERVERGRRQDEERRRQEERTKTDEGRAHRHDTARAHASPPCPVPDAKPPPHAHGPLFAQSKPLPVPVERHPESPFPLQESYATLMEEANRNFDPYA